MAKKEKKRGFSMFRHKDGSLSTEPPAESRGPKPGTPEFTRRVKEMRAAFGMSDAPKSSRPSASSVMAFGGRGSGDPAPKTSGLAAWEKSAEMRLAEKKMRVAADLAESGAPQERVEQRLAEALEHAEKSGSEQAKKKAMKAAADVRKKVLTRSGGPAGGGGGGDQPRAPAGGSDGGQWVKG